jgi:tetratricopeptide (TPR) repeat protein
MKRVAAVGALLLTGGVPHTPGAEKPARPAESAARERTDQQKAAQQLHDEAMKAFSAGALEIAKIGFQKVLAISPDNAPALLNLALVEQRQGRYGEAERHLRKVLRLDLDNATAWLIMGIGAYEQDKLDAAHAWLAQAVLFAPKDARAHHYLGVTLGRRGWYSAGEDELRRAVELNPKFADAHYNLALLYVERLPPAIELARRHYQKALDLGASPDERLAMRIEQ